MDAVGQDISSAITSISKAIDGLLARLQNDASVREHRSSRQHTWDLVFRATTAILAVASPALVTYSTTAGVADFYKIAAIILSGVAGAAATLQAIFALQQGYVRNAIDALELYEVKAQLESDRNEALQKGSDFEKYAQLKVVLGNAMRGHKAVIVAKQKAYLEKALPN